MTSIRCYQVREDFERSIKEEGMLAFGEMLLLYEPILRLQMSFIIGLAQQFNKPTIIRMLAQLNMPLLMYYLFGDGNSLYHTRNSEFVLDHLKPEELFNGLRARRLSEDLERFESETNFISLLYKASSMLFSYSIKKLTPDQINLLMEECYYERESGAAHLLYTQSWENIHFIFVRCLPKTLVKYTQIHGEYFFEKYSQDLVQRKRRGLGNPLLEKSQLKKIFVILDDTISIARFDAEGYNSAIKHLRSNHSFFRILENVIPRKIKRTSFSQLNYWINLAYRFYEESNRGIEDTELVAGLIIKNLLPLRILMMYKMLEDLAHVSSEQIDYLSKDFEILDALLCNNKDEIYFYYGKLFLDLLHHPKVNFHFNAMEYCSRAFAAIDPEKHFLYDKDQCLVIAQHLYYIQNENAVFFAKKAYELGNKQAGQFLKHLKNGVIGNEVNISVTKPIIYAPLHHSGFMPLQRLPLSLMFSEKKVIPNTEIKQETTTSLMLFGKKVKPLDDDIADAKIELPTLWKKLKNTFTKELLTLNTGKFESYIYLFEDFNTMHSTSGLTNLKLDVFESVDDPALKEKVKKQINAILAGLELLLPKLQSFKSQQ